MAAGMQFTERAQKALSDAANLAEQYAHIQIMPLHLAVALFDLLLMNRKIRSRQPTRLKSPPHYPYFDKLSSVLMATFSCSTER